MKKIILYSWMLPLTVFGATSSVVETIAEAEGITLNEGWYRKRPNNFEKKIGMNLNGAMVCGYSVYQTKPNENYIKIFDKDGYRIAGIRFMCSDSFYTLLWHAWKERGMPYMHWSDLKLDNAEYEKRNGAYYFYFTDKEDSTNRFLSEVISGKYKLLFVSVGSAGQAEVPPKVDRLYPEWKRPSVDEYEKIATTLLNTLNNNTPLETDVPELERRMQKMAQRERQRELSRPGYAEFYWNCWGLGTQCSLGSEVAEKLGITLNGEVPKDPNIHWGELFAKGLVKNVAKMLNRGNGRHFELPEPPVNDKFFHIAYRESGSEKDTGVHVRVAHLLDTFQAKRVMYAFVTAKGDDGNLEERFKTADEIIQAVQQLPKPPVGEYAVRLKPFVDTDGLPVKGSEKRSIYFTRGNTAVAVWTENPTFNVLPAAREIDKLLVEGMRKAGEPITKEQDYLKEEKKQK